MKHCDIDLIKTVGFYDTLCVLIKDFGKENIEESKKKKVLKTVRREAEYRFDADSKDKEIFFKADLSYDELMGFFKSRLKEFAELKEKADKENYKTARLICKDFDVALECLERDYTDFHIKDDEGNIELLLVDNSAFTKKLIFHNAYSENIINFFETPLWVELYEYGDKYCLEMLVDNYFEDETVKTKIIFSSCEVETQVFNAVNTVVFSNPWDYLRNIAFALLEKEKYAADYLNDMEKDLLPLAEALVNIPYSAGIHYEKPDEPEKQNALIELSKSLVVYDDIEKKKLYITTLCDKKYEGLWRVIYNKFFNSQEGYAKSSEVICTEETISQRRNKISDIVKEAGFQGEYPDFYRDGEIIKPKEVTTYGLDLIVGFEKNCRFHIKCIEDGEIINFLCGYVCLGKHPHEYNDAFSASFYDKGKRYFTDIVYTPEDEELSGIIYMPTVEECARVAVKKANLENLTKTERKHFSDPIFSSKKKFTIILFMAIISGTLYSLGMSGFALITDWIETGSFQQALDNLKDFPWLFSGLGFGVLFSVLMNFTELFGSKK
ncbi:MAG: DUF3878 family protein [Clostridia bacterium]|nr:DUF3878 family protein [Clostridia bacterium]